MLEVPRRGSRTAGSWLIPFPTTQRPTDHGPPPAVAITKLALYLGGSKLLSESGAEGTDAENYLVDRNFIVGAGP